MSGLADEQTRIVSEPKVKLVRDAFDLRVFQTAYAVSLQIHKTTLTFPKIEQYALGDQLRRASKSICANLAEGFERQKASSTEFKRYLMIAQGSCSECKVWIRYALDLEYIDKENALKWHAEYDSIGRMLQKLRINL